MRDSVARIGRVRLKGGADLHIIDGGNADLTNSFLQAAEKIVELCPDMAGYAIVSWDFKGAATRGWEHDKRSPVRESLIPSYVRDILLKEVTKVQTLEDLQETDE